MGLFFFTESDVLIYLMVQCIVAEIVVSEITCRRVVVVFYIFFFKTCLNSYRRFLPANAMISA